MVASIHWPAASDQNSSLDRSRPERHGRDEADAEDEADQLDRTLATDGAAALAGSGSAGAQGRRRPSAHCVSRRPGRSPALLPPRAGPPTGTPGARYNVHRHARRRRTVAIASLRLSSWAAARAPSPGRPTRRLPDAPWIPWRDTPDDLQVGPEANGCARSAACRSTEAPTRVRRGPARTRSSVRTPAWTSGRLRRGAPMRRQDHDGRVRALGVEIGVTAKTRPRAERRQRRRQPRDHRESVTGSPARAAGPASRRRTPSLPDQRVPWQARGCARRSGCG